MKIPDEILPEILYGSKTLENAIWRLAVKLFQAQTIYNNDKPASQQLDTFMLEITNREDILTGVITITDLDIELRVADFFIAAISEIEIKNYKLGPSGEFSFPWSAGRAGINVFFNLLLQLALLQVSKEYNPNSNDFISVTISQSKTLKEFPFSVSATITFPLFNVIDEKEFVCNPVEVLTGESPWKITTP